MVDIYLRKNSVTGKGYKPEFSINTNRFFTRLVAMGQRGEKNELFLRR
jgi:hypothetical protein